MLTNCYNFHFFKYLFTFLPLNFPKILLGTSFPFTSLTEMLFRIQLFVLLFNTTSFCFVVVVVCLKSFQAFTSFFALQSCFDVVSGELSLIFFHLKIIFFYVSFPYSFPPFTKSLIKETNLPLGFIL